MKNLIIGLAVIGSFSSIASDSCQKKDEVSILCGELTEADFDIGSKIRLKKGLELPKGAKSLTFGKKGAKCSLVAWESEDYDRFVMVNPKDYAVIGGFNFEYKSRVNIDELVSYEGERSLSYILLENSKTFSHILCTPEVNSKEKFESVMSDVLELQSGRSVRF